MFLFKKKNKGYALVMVLMIGAVLLITGYYLYDQLILSRKIVSRNVYQSQLDLYNISIADTVQTILNAVVTDENEDQVALFERARLGGSIAGQYKAGFYVAKESVFPGYVKKVYKSGYATETESPFLDKLEFSFSGCNFMNTKLYDSFITNKDVKFLEQCDENDKDLIKTNVVVTPSAENILFEVESFFSEQSLYAGIKSSSSFIVTLPPKATECEKYVMVDSKTDKLVFNKNIDYVTLPGLIIDEKIFYKFLISRYGGTNFTSRKTTNKAGDTVYKGSFTVYTYYRSSERNRFTSYLYKHSMVIPTGKENFWHDPKEFEGCNKVYPLGTGRTGSTTKCNPETDPKTMDKVSLGNGGWSDRHIFKVVYKPAKNYSKATCSISKSTISGLTPGIRQTGCFDENTLVEDNLGNKIKIKDLTMGQALKNPITKGIVRVTKTVAGLENRDLIEIVTNDNNSILVTQDHPLKTKRGLITAGELNKKDLLLNEKGFIKISSINEVPSNDRVVYNLKVSSGNDKDVDEDHYILANGIVSGDLYLQSKLKYKDSLAKR